MRDPLAPMSLREVTGLLTVMSGGRITWWWFRIADDEDDRE